MSLFPITKPVKKKMGVESMKNIEIKNIIKLCSFNLITTRKTIIGWGIAIFAIMTLYMILFPSIQDLAQAKFDAMPAELMQFVGMENMSDMSNYVTYYGMIYNLILVAVSIFSATFSARLITKEEKSKSIEFLNSLAVSRLEIYISKYVTALIAVALILSGAIISVIACGFIGGGESFILADIIASAKITSFSALLFGGIGFMLAGINAKIGTGSVVASVVLLSYMLGYLGELLGDNAQWLAYFSPFITLHVGEVIALSDQTMYSLVAYIVIYVVALIIGGLVYRKRDLSI